MSRLRRRQREDIWGLCLPPQHQPSRPTSGSKSSRPNQKYRGSNRDHTNKLIKLLKLSHFSEEIRTLWRDRDTTVKRKLQQLNQFLDKEGILQIDGRLSHSPMPFPQKHSIILPTSSVTTTTTNLEHNEQSYFQAHPGASYDGEDNDEDNRRLE